MRTWSLRVFRQFLRLALSALHVPGEASQVEEIYVRPFPNVESDRVQVSIEGGTRPAWDPSGRDMFYLDRQTRLTAVRVQARDSKLTVGSPKTLLECAYFAGAARLPVVRTICHSTVVQNWLEELKRLVPAK
jgi:hypothetical protein